MQWILDSNATHEVSVAAQALSASPTWSKVSFGAHLDRRTLGNSRGLGVLCREPLLQEGDMRGMLQFYDVLHTKCSKGVYDIKDLFMPASCPSSSLLNPVLPFWNVTCHLSQCTGPPHFLSQIVPRALLPPGKVTLQFVLKMWSTFLPCHFFHEQKVKAITSVAG